VDSSVGDRLGKLALTDEGFYQRETQVLSTCLAGDYHVACVIGGGFAEEIKGLVYNHCSLHRAAKDFYK
jgi:acetoin utilization deacetylase AcuC-like enzyme